MTAGLVVMATIFVWGLVSARLEHADFTAPVVFVTVGGVLSATGVVDAPSAPETLRPLVELTLVWVLFTDAAGVRLRELRADLGQDVRLLAFGLPLTIALGTAFASWLFPTMGLWPALLVGAALAPTDAALGLPVVSNPHVPRRIRRLITVESGLNDGIVTPVVVFAIAATATAEGVVDAPARGAALAELTIGLLVGVVLGLAGGSLMRLARGHGWASEDYVGVAVLALAVAAYAGAVGLHGNGFIAAFCAGLAFGATAGRRAPAELLFLEQAGSLMSMLIWFAFGVVTIPIIVDRTDLSTLLYSVLSLTVVRMLPVALSAIGSTLDRASVMFIGWFGPRGLASLVFALLALEELGQVADEAVAVIGTTVLLSVVAHGFSAAPLAKRFGDAESTGEASGGAPR